MSSLLEAVAYTDGSLGYTYKYYLFQSFSEGKQYSPAEELKTLSINGIAPSSQNIVNASYPFSVNYYGVIRKGDEQKTGGLFLEWMLSLEGQACIRQAGYIPMDGRYTAYYFDSDGFVFPDSSKRLLNEADMERLYENSYYDRSMLEMLGFARNEIFARHGHGFQNAKYTEHYAQFGWYTALPRKTVQLSELNAAEQANVRFIKQWEETTRARMSENARGLEAYRVR